MDEDKNGIPGIPSADMPMAGGTDRRPVATLGWHFVDRNVRDKSEYFVNFGPGIAFGLGRSKSSPWASLGGGGIAWINDRVGIRFEVRSQAMSDEGMIVGRIGVSFR